MIKVGITGLMGSGKSFISNLFKEAGVPIYNSDERAKYLINNNPNLIEEITNGFGDVYINGELNRDKLRQIVFISGNEDRLTKLNQIVHPYIFDDFNDFCLNHSDSPMILAESAILFESKMNVYLDRIIFVNVSYDIRLQRAISRDNISKEEYDNRMKNQIPLEEKIRLSDFVIDNNNTSLLSLKKTLTIIHYVIINDLP